MAVVNVICVSFTCLPGYSLMALMSNSWPLMKSTVKFLNCCFISTAQQLPGETVVIGQSPPNSDPAMTQTSSIITTTPATAGPGPVVNTYPVNCPTQNQDNLLVIILPVAIGVVLIITFIVALLVCICCMKFSHREKE